MAGCDGRFVIFLTFMTALAWFPGIECSDYGRLNVYESSTLKEKIELSRHHPLCVVLRIADKDTRLEDSVNTLVVKEGNGGGNKFKKWQFGSFAFEKVTLPPIHRPVSFPTLRCYTGKHTYQEFNGKHSTKAVSKWLERLVLQQAKYLEDASMSAVELAQEQFNTVLIAFPDTARHAQIEEMVFQEKEKLSNAKAFIVHEDATDLKIFKNKFKMRKLPAVVVTHKDNVNDTGPTTVKVLSGVTLTQQSLGVCLQARHMGIPHYDMARFKSLMETSGSFVPTLVGFYSYFGSHAQLYLRLLSNSVEEFRDMGVNVRFGLVNIEEADINLILSRWVDPKLTLSFPVAILYYWDNSSKIAQIKVSEQRLTPLNLHRVLKETVGFVDREGQEVPYNPLHGYNPLEISAVFEGPLGTKCSQHSHNLTDNYPIQVQPVKRKRKVHVVTVEKKEEVKLWHDMFGTETINKNLDMVENIPVLTGQYWSEVIEKSHAPQHPLQGGREWAGEVTKVALVVFVMAECRSCKNSMPVFENLEKSVKYIEGGSMYLVNCSVDHALCKNLDIRGYPTVTAFRGLGWLHSSRCIGDEAEKLAQHNNYVRLDYHGVLLHDNIMDWFARVSAPAITDNLFDWPDAKADDVSLFGVLTPKKSDFLPIPPQRSIDYYYSYECFRLVCERLYGKVHCHSVYNRDIPEREFEDDDLDLIVSKVILKRKDGVSAVIMKLGTSLQDTVEDESDTNLHKFHKPHRYNLRPNTRCEQDHVACTNLIIAYTMDHSRLPVTQLTSDLFHIHSSESMKDSLPVMMALVHRQNITEDSQFIKELRAVAYELYNNMEVVTVDADDYRGWAVRFVPEGYSMTVAMDGEDPLDMHVFPRICFVKRDNHRRAAFYPPVGSDLKDESWFQKENLLNFARKVLSRPEKHMIGTDHF
ncbi:uncharacterized protein LOC110452507 [Mizuhopecten yessoensis]|uniref:Thioredoxin domain-containing protein n=1 Tax=Mizuhopecten yessoensis TaxID=6573 RepID=A0A210QJD6_MIZYE|nr:uncharacterized protein LOC110452507 [Mizuhopecten yessoensis]OWF48857.1 hypothetical protein KP79_PYT08755 [Mizuhopecten yessoensis]